MTMTTFIIAIGVLVIVALALFIKMLLADNAKFMKIISEYRDTNLDLHSEPEELITHLKER